MTFLTDELLRGVDWRGLERAVARVMSHCGWRGVQVVGRKGDGGGDVIGVRDQDGRDLVYVVQVKAVSRDGYIGTKAIQEAVDALSIYRGDVAVVATNGTFAQAAVKRRDELERVGFKVRLWNGLALRKLLDHWPERHWLRNEPRAYQERIIEQCLRVHEEGGHRAQFILATGLGKSVIAAEILSRMADKGFRRSLVLCHAQDLALQLEQSFWRQLPQSLPTRVFFGGESPHPYEGVNFGLYQTLQSYLGSLDASDFDVVVVDEAHHALAPGFRACVDALRPELLVGMTATPWRGDGRSIDEVFDTPVASLSVVDGMKLGFLAQVNYRIYCDNVDWQRIPRLTGGEMTIRDLNKKLFLPQRDDAVVSTIKKAAAALSSPRVMVFCASVEHGARFAEFLSYNGIECRALSGLDKVTRNRHLMEFTAGKIQAVTAVDVLNEGIDVPDVNMLVFLRCTHSRRVFVQQLGRGLRVNEGKTHVTVLDFVADVRRIAEVLEMDRDVRRPKGRSRKILFPEGIVTFSDANAGTFFQEWVADINELSGMDDESVLRFP